jgi:hypothetical protein
MAGMSSSAEAVRPSIHCLDRVHRQERLGGLLNYYEHAA